MDIGNNDIKDVFPNVSEQMRGRAAFYFDEGWEICETSTAEKLVFHTPYSCGTKTRVVTLEENKATKISTI